MDNANAKKLLEKLDATYKEFSLPGRLEILDLANQVMTEFQEMKFINEATKLISNLGHNIRVIFKDGTDKTGVLNFVKFRGFSSKEKVVICEITQGQGVFHFSYHLVESIEIVNHSKHKTRILCSGCNEVELVAHGQCQPCANKSREILYDLIDLVNIQF